MKVNFPPPYRPPASNSSRPGSVQPKELAANQAGGKTVNRPNAAGGAVSRIASSTPAWTRDHELKIGPPTPIGAGVYRIEMRSPSAGKIGSVDLGPIRGRRAEVSNLTVVQAFRRQGVGTRIMNATVAAARNLGVERLVLTAHPAEGALPAHALTKMYATLGFQQTGLSGRADPVMERSLGVAQPKFATPPLRGARPTRSGVVQRMLRNEGLGGSGGDDYRDDDSDEEKPWQKKPQKAAAKSSAVKSVSAQSGGKSKKAGAQTPSLDKTFGIKIGSHVRGDIIHYAAVAASMPGATFSFDPYDSMLWFEKRNEVEQWIHFLELNGAEFQCSERLEDAGEATLSMVRHSQKHQGAIGLSKAVFERPHHTNKYIKELLEAKCPGILNPAKKVLVWVRQKEKYATHRNSPADLLSILVSLVRSCKMMPILIGDTPAMLPKGEFLDLTEYWKWEEDVPGPMKIRKRPFSGVDSMQRQLMFLELLRCDYKVCAQTGVKSGALDLMAFCGLKTIVIDLEPDTRLRLRMARYATVAANYFIVYPNYDKPDKHGIITFPEKLTGKVVLHTERGLDPPHLGEPKPVKNADSKKGVPEYHEAETKDWDATVAELLKRQ